MVRAPDINQGIGFVGFLEVIGEIGAEIGPCPVRLLDRPVLVIAELGRTEQRQLNRLPVFRRGLALWRFKHTVIDKPVFAQPFFCFFRLPRGLQFSFRGEHRVLDTEPREIGADHVHHRRDGLLAEDGKPLIL